MVLTTRPRCIETKKKNCSFQCATVLSFLSFPLEIPQLLFTYFTLYELFWVRYNPIESLNDTEVLVIQHMYLCCAWLLCKATLSVQTSTCLLFRSYARWLTNDILTKNMTSNSSLDLIINYSILKCFFTNYILYIYKRHLYISIIYRMLGNQ